MENPGVIMLTLVAKSLYFCMMFHQKDGRIALGFCTKMQSESVSQEQFFCIFRGVSFFLLNFLQN